MRHICRRKRHNKYRKYYYKRRENAYKLRSIIEKASISLTDEDALQAVELYPLWLASTAYSMSKRIRYK